MRKVSILGSTGSIGTQCLDVIRLHRDIFSVTCLSCGKNTTLFGEQLKEFKPALAVCANKEDALSLAVEFPRVKFLWGMEGLQEAAVNGDSDILVNAVVGMVGLRPTYEAIKAGRNIAFANKETLVAGGSLIMDAVKKNRVDFIPVDSEPSAIFQCLRGNEMNPVKRIILTASGGPFRTYTEEMLRGVTKAQALKHPNWTMGAKITVDSATMMNKGLELIECSLLFGVLPSKIQVHIHPESIVHSAVEFEDGSVMAQMGSPDMRVPISYALSVPRRMRTAAKPLNLFELGALSFEKPDLGVFRCLALAYEAVRRGGSYTVALNAANEEAVAAFLRDEISFCRISDMVESALNHHKSGVISSIEDIFEVERETRAYLR